MKSFIAKYWIATITSLTAFLVPVKPYLMIVGTAVVLDAFIAVYAATKLGGAEAFQSKKLKDTVAKTVIYMGAIILTRQIDLIYDMDTIMRIIFGVILLTELRSIDEKYFKLYGKSLFKYIFDRLPNMNKEKDKDND